MAATQYDTTSAPLTLLAEVAAKLHGDQDIVRKATDLLESAVRILGAQECSLWLVTPRGLVCAARAGQTSANAADIAVYLEAGDADAETIAVRALLAGTRRVGALALRLESGITPDIATAFTAMAHLVAPALIQAEHSRSMATDLEQVTRQAADERRFLQDVCDALPLSIYIIDRDYRIQVWNRHREAGSQGVQRENALGRTIFDILHRAPAARLKREFEEVFRSGRLQQFDIESRATGERRTYRITKVPVHLADGAPPTHVITIGEDVTEAVEMQERFAQSERYAATGQLLAGVLTEARRPVAGMAWGVDALAAEFTDMQRSGAPASPAAERVLGSLREDAQRCRKLLEPLLALVRPGGGTRAPVNVNKVAEQVLAVLKGQPQFSRLTLQAVLDPSLPDVYGSRDELMQLFLALLQNAADAMSGEGTITVRTHVGASPQAAVVAEVIDVGRGIPRAELPRIFEPFFSTKAPGHGTGLGLSICHSIVTGHGGRIEVDSAVGAGSTFRVLLPEVNLA